MQVVVVVDTRGLPCHQDKNRAPVAVTLGSVGGPGDLELFMENAAEWGGPKVNALVELSLGVVGVYVCMLGVAGRNLRLYVTTSPRTGIYGNQNHRLKYRQE